MNTELFIACPEVWDYKRKPCEAWGGPMSHGCKLRPWHDGDHVCPCGSRHSNPLPREETAS